MMETYFGHIKTPQDALIIFEACRRGQLHRVQRRLSSKERVTIRSGSVFAWDENEAGMRRWTDGRTWSPSRVLGSFLTYRELDTKRRPRRNKTTPAYSYKPDGLIKQSFSICTATNQKLHLISYYTKADVVAGRFQVPSMDRQLNDIIVPKGLYPELNPLETSGGHSAAIHSMMSYNNQHRQQQQHHREQQQQQHLIQQQPAPLITRPYHTTPPPSLSSSPVSSDEEVASDTASPVFSSTLSTPTSLLPPPISRNNSISGISTTTFQSLMLPACSDAAASEDRRQLDALRDVLRL
ncbi:hypothetical protein VTP01DRAFT_2267 [Rhizomucor pusillus]|uniref:uncharacterized protein n=1 Tax=Rhizomucor pusillus TaxID=4840 RepID=UPI0037445DB5